MKHSTFFRALSFGVSLVVVFDAPSRVRAAASSEEGRVLSRVFLPEDYHGDIQITDVVQTPDGLIYASNLGSIKEYDGRVWRSIPVPTSWIMDLNVTPDGRVILAGVDEIGLLELGTDGRRVFRSLLDHVPDGLKPLGQQWSCVFNDGAAYWSTARHVLRWRDGVMRTWSFPEGTRIIVRNGGKNIYLAASNDALYRLDGDEWRVVSRDARVAVSPPAVYDDWAGRELVVVGGDGKLWSVAVDGTISEVPTVLTPDDVGGRIIDATRLRDGRLALATKSNGLIVLTTDGKIDLQFGTDGGVSVPTMYSMCEDREGGLWMGTAFGTVRVEIDRSITVFDEKNGAPPGVGYIVARHEGRLFACGADGLYRFAPGENGRRGRFARVPTSLAFYPYALLSHRSGLLIGADFGLFRLAGDGVITSEFESPHSLYVVSQSLSDPDRVFAGTTEYLFTLRWDGTRWQNEGAIAGLQEDVRSIVEDPAGSLWVGTPSRGIVRVRRQPGREDWQSAQIDAFDSTRGLPVGHEWVNAYKSAVGPLFAHARGVSVYDPGTDRVVPAAAFATSGLQGRYTFPLAAGKDGALWVQLGEAARGDALEMGGVLPARGGGWRWQTLNPRVYQALGFLGAGEFAWEPGYGGEGVLWVIGQKNIVRWDLGGVRQSRDNPPAPVVLRDVLRGEATLPLRTDTPPALNFAREPLRLRFASPLFGTQSTVQFQFRLLGYDDRWSPWSERDEATFTNLEAGNFSFEVRARRGNEAPGNAAVWKFSVRPPWWRGRVAIAGCALAALAAIFALFRWRVAAIEGERRRLEALVQQRTTELAHARDRAEDANRAKSMFLASMSHELRTPLHAILGYSQLLSADNTMSEAARDRLRVVAASGQHLLRLINEVLDLSKIEAGKLELRAEPLDLPGFLGEIAVAHETRAVAKQIVFQRPDPTGLAACVMGDGAKLRQVLDNLLGNAIKFTAAGEVRLSVTPAADACVRFEVSDTGPGMSPADFERVFEPFTQATAGERANEAGTGLGLAITRRLVALMGGNLEVASVVGEGSRFWFEVALPEAPVARVALARGTKRIVGYDGPRRRVLAIDDAAANRQLFTDLLAPLGFEVAMAASAEEAFTMIERFRPDLVLLDLRLPGMDGFAFARKLRDDPRFEGVKILAASASVLGQDANAALAAGCDGFLPKPFLAEEFFARLADMLGLVWREVDVAPPANDEAVEPAVLEALAEAARLGDVVAMRETLAQLRALHPRATALAELEPRVEAFDTAGVSRVVEELLRRPADEGRP